MTCKALIRYWDWGRVASMLDRQRAFLDMQRAYWIDSEHVGQRGTGEIKIKGAWLIRSTMYVSLAQQINGPIQTATFATSRLSRFPP